MRLSESEIKKRLKEIDGWTRAGHFIRKQFSCENFKAAIKFVNSVADLAERNDHHPDILISNYNKVTITLATHSVNGLTELDFTLADLIEKLNP